MEEEEDWGLGSVGSDGSEKEEVEKRWWVRDGLVRVRWLVLSRRAIIAENDEEGVGFEMGRRRGGEIGGFAWGFIIWADDKGTRLLMERILST